MSAKTIPVAFQDEPIAVNTKQAAALLSCSVKTVWRMTAIGKLKRLPFGNYSVEELRRFAREESR